MPDILIREAAPADAGAVSELIAQLGYSLKPADVISRLERCNKDSGRVFVATWDSKIVGFISFHEIPLFHQGGSLGRITAMAVSVEHHRKGIGRLLLQSAESHALSVGCIRMEVTSGDHREADAHSFYESQGYASDCRRFLKIIA